MPVLEEPGLTVDELQRLLRAADPAAVLVPPRLLRRIIKTDRKLRRLGLQVPHRKCYVISQEALWAIISRAELPLPHDEALPETLLLLKSSADAALGKRTRAQNLANYWQLLFHARVHKELRDRFKEAQIAEVDLRRRIEKIGLTEFAEIEAVLRQERFLLPPEDDETVYEEFVAFFLQLWHFARPLLPKYFSSIDDFERLERIVAEDVDGAALFAATRLADAPEPAWVSAGEREPAPDAGQGHELLESVGELKPYSFNTSRSDKARFDSLVANAERASAKGNVVRSAIWRVQAARLAASNGEVTSPGRISEESAGPSYKTDLLRLVERLRGSLHLGPADIQIWHNALLPLLAHAPDGVWPPEARLLYELQKICIDHERPIYVPDIMEWLYSGLSQPFLQALPDQPLVLAVKHLRVALKRLSSVRVSEKERHALAHVLHRALSGAEHRVRERFRPRLKEVLERVALRPQNFPERMAENKLIEELLDRINEHGFLNMSHLRDALARNQLKLADLAGPREFFRGDPLIRANRRLARTAVGIYHRGEFYLRWLQRGSALAFGTRPGRFLMLFLILPFLGAFASIVFVQEMLHVLRLLHIAHIPHHLSETEFAAWMSGLGVFYLGLIHSRHLRMGVALVLGAGWRILANVFWHWPVQLLRVPLIRDALESRFYAILVQLLLKPLLPGAVIWALLWHRGLDVQEAALRSAGISLCLGAFLTTRFGQDLEESLLDLAVRNWDRLRGFLPGLFRLVMNFFKVILEAVDRFLYTVDEWLRFRGGEGRVTLVLKVGLGFIWFLVTYVIRLYVNVFIEPTVNPIKHFPVVTVAAKLLVPFWPVLLGTPHHPGLLGVPFTFFGPGMQFLMANVILHSLPGAAGFLVWEFKENWRLYRSNRPRYLKPEIIGHHGETVLRLLRPGFHSGTLPKLYAKLRRSERRASRGRSWRTPRRLGEALHHVEDSIAKFVEREFIAFVRSAKQWHAGPIHLQQIKAGANRIRIMVAGPAPDQSSFELFFDIRESLLLARVAQIGWLTHISDRELSVFAAALIGFYHKAGVQLVHEQMEAAALFNEQPLAWQTWVTAWQAEEQGAGDPRTFLPAIPLPGQPVLRLL